jgi:hypothetical protein
VVCVSILLKEIKYISNIFFKQSQASPNTALQFYALAICLCKLHCIKRHSINWPVLVPKYHRYSIHVLRSYSDFVVKTFCEFTRQ